MSDTKIMIAEVKTTVDASRSGKITVLIGEKKELSVNYVSPYGSNTEGAFIALPEPGTQVLICSPEDSFSWYYIGTTFMPESKDSKGAKIPDGELKPIERSQPELYKARGRPMKYSFKSPTGAGITMHEDYNKEYFNKKVEITSGVNKKITLNDSPEVDAITIDSGNGSKITLSNDPQGMTSDAKAIQVESSGPQKYINKESQTDIVVDNGGRDLNIINNAHGLLWGPLVDTGCINLQSKYKDVNIFSKGHMGSIYLQCLNPLGLNQKIVLETRGVGGGDIILKTNGTIKLQAGVGIEMTAPVIKTQAGTQNATVANFNVASLGPVNIDGSIINLAGGAASPDPVIPTFLTNSRYGFLGLTNYDFFPFPIIPAPY